MSSGGAQLIDTPLPTVTSAATTAATLGELVQLQYTRGKTFAAWSNLFRMMLRGDISALDYDGLVSRIILPQIQAVNNVFRAASSSESSCRFAGPWASRVQALERKRYDGIVRYQQSVVDHLSSVVSLEGHTHTKSEHHHHQCCSAEHRAHTTSCLFYDGNGTRAAEVVAAMRKEREQPPVQPVGSSTAAAKETPESESAASERAQSVAQQKSFISNLMSGPAQSADVPPIGAIPQFLSFGSQKTIPTVFGGLSLEYIVPMEWVQPVSAVGEAGAVAVSSRDIDADSDEEPASERPAEGQRKAPTQIVGDSDEECCDAASGDGTDDEEDDEELSIRRAATSACTVFGKQVRSFSSAMISVESQLQDAMDEAMEEMQD